MTHSARTFFACLAFLLLAAAPLGTAFAVQSDPRRDVLLDSAWQTAEDDSDPHCFPGFRNSGFEARDWRVVDVPHNWDDYGGYRQLRHGNRHGYACYRRSFTLDPADRGRRVFLYFEGVGSYATVWVNGHEVGRHAGALTTFTLDVTDAVTFDQPNLLAVRADSPTGIRDLPWVCGGCSDEPGFSEGSEPFGICRPVHVITTSPLRVEPFGVHVWNGTDISASSAVVHLETEIRNYAGEPRQFRLLSRLLDASGHPVAEIQAARTLGAASTTTIRQDTPPIPSPHLWSPADPYLYTLRTDILSGDTLLDRVETPFGIRTISWPAADGSDHRPLLINGRPFFINGSADYEHLLGASHAFSAEQIRARARQVEAAGFNAFRDAHQPHDLRFNQYWDRDGLLWWPQFSAHIWFDTDAFRSQFKTLLRDWVRERRNSPSLVLWGLQNESRLPKDFAEECCQIIRELDPTASSQRRITTCNGGKGTDWNVPQNWSGTYGGKPAEYAADLQRQVLVGEYGAWRAIGEHTEGPFEQKGPLSEDRLNALMEMKIRLAESVRDSACGQFQWIFTSHDNPGRTVDLAAGKQRDGFRPLDQVGPVNNKGLFTIWGEPTDAFYLYRSNYASPATQPMVYIVSHTWADRWTSPGRKSGIIVYSNCDEVELFNDVGACSLGRRTRPPGKGTHFQWDDVDIRYNVLYAEARIAGKVVATDCIQLHNLPPAPHLPSISSDSPDLTAPTPGQNYLYRVNCGGPDYIDSHGNVWLADRTLASPSDSWGSRSWAADDRELDPRFASQRKISDPIAGTADGRLFQTFRYGRSRLRYKFALPDGSYRVELYFIEPWYGTGGGLDCTGWRLFDVALNGQTVLKDLDLWKDAGRAHAIKKVVTGTARDGKLELSFPRVAAGQAVISAIAISTANPSLHPPAMPAPLAVEEPATDSSGSAASPWSVQTCLDEGDCQYADANVTITRLPPDLIDATWIRTAQSSRQLSASTKRFRLTARTDIFVALDTRVSPVSTWFSSWESTDQQVENSNGSRFRLFRRSASAGETLAFGPNGDTGADMYTIFLQPYLPHATSLAATRPAAPAAIYEAEAATLQHAAVALAVPGYSGNGYVELGRDSNSSITWPIPFGVAEPHRFSLRYANPSADPVEVTVALTAEDGTVLQTDTLTLKPTAASPEGSSRAWRTITFATRSSINAGTYKVSFHTAAHVYVDSLKVE